MHPSGRIRPSPSRLLPGGAAAVRCRRVSRPWVLVLGRPSGDPRRRVGGLSLALRLALDAQRAGAAGVVCDEAAGITSGELADGRLTIPISGMTPEGMRRIIVAASILAHRSAWPALVERDGDGVLTAGAEPPSGTPFGFAAIDVMDTPSARSAERALFRSLRKPQDGWTARWLNRYVSLSLSRHLVKTPLSPNQVSVGILAIGLAGAYLASLGTYWSMLAGAALFQAQSILDGCDGEMSRVSYRGSLLGEWLDTIGDDVTNYAFFAGAAVGLHARTGNPLYLVAGAVTVGSGVIGSLIEYRYLAKIGSGDLLKYPTSQTASTATGLLAAIAPLFKRDTFVFLTLVAAALGLLGPMLVIFAVAAVGILANILAAEAKMARERREAPASPPPGAARASPESGLRHDGVGRTR
jgi:phosphatidylglycerophosphate synthase